MTDDIDKVFVSGLSRASASIFSRVRELGILPEDLADPESATLYRFLVDHWEEHRAVPSTQTIAFAFGLLPEPTEVDVLFAARKVLERTARNEILSITGRALASLEKGTDPFSVRARVQKDLATLRTPTGQTQIYDLADLAKDVEEEFTSAARGDVGLPFPWPSATRRTRGMSNGDLCLIGGRSGTGKSWALLLFALTLRAAGVPVLFVTTEMRAQTIAYRYAALVAKLPYRRFRNGQLTREELARFRATVAKFRSDRGFSVTGGTFDQSFDGVKSAIVSKKPRAVLIDGAYLLKGIEGKTRTEKAAYTFDELKRIIHYYNVVGIATSQLNREARGKGAEDVKDEHFALSDVLVWHAAFVFALTRSAYMGRESRMDVSCLKVREDAPIPPIRTHWDLFNMNFDEVPTEGGGEADESPFASDTSVAPAQEPTPVAPGEPSF